MVPAVDRCARINDAPAGFYSAEAREIFREFTASRSDEVDNLGLIFAFSDKTNVSGRNPAVAVDQKVVGSESMPPYSSATLSLPTTTG